MKDKKKRLSNYIDTLNQEKKPAEHGEIITDRKYDRMLATVRRIKSLRGAELPGEKYPLVLSEKVWQQMQGNNSRAIRAPERRRPTAWRHITLFAGVAAAATVIIFVAPKVLQPINHTNIVYAMEKAIQEVKAYHGRIAVVETNELNETVTQAEREVWASSDGKYYVKELSGTAKDIITINNGEKKWQLRPQEKAVYLFSTFPDPYRFTFELADELAEVKSARTVKELGEERILDRNTTVLEITPQGGEPYRLWVDQETKLPLQRVTAMQNAIRYKVTYTSIEFKQEIPEELLAYTLPEGFTERDQGADQLVNTLEEAESMAGFRPVLPDTTPKDYILSRIAFVKKTGAVRLTYTSASFGTVVIQQSPAGGDFKADPTAMIGKVNQQIAEVIAETKANSIRWQEEGKEYYILGEASFTELKSFVQELTKGEVELPAGALGPTEEKTEVESPDKEEGQWKEPQVKVEVDLMAEENEQKSVDAGHSPWKLDPVFVSQVFASLLLSPEGIVGDYPIPYEAITMIENDGSRAIARIDDKQSIARIIYLERLIRKDETGIWSVVGYDKVDSK